MLKIIEKFSSLNFEALMQVYSQSNIQSGADSYQNLSASELLINAQQDHYVFLREFLRQRGAFCAVWEEDGRYLSALRIEPYRDGLLLEGLETLPEARRRGYAKKLIESVCNYLKKSEEVILYSHIANDNIASIAVHKSCGFEKKSDMARYIDGSVSSKASTYIKRI